MGRLEDKAAGSTLRIRAADSPANRAVDYGDSRITASAIDGAEAAPVATTMTITIRPCPRWYGVTLKTRVTLIALTATAAVP